MSLYNYFSHDNHEAEQKLFAAILNQTIYDSLQTFFIWKPKAFRRKVFDLKARKYVEEITVKKIAVLNKECDAARKWILSKNKHFDFYCDGLGITPHSARQFFKKLFSRFPINEIKEVEKLKKKMSSKFYGKKIIKK